MSQQETVCGPGVCEQIKKKVAKCEICNKYRNCQVKEPLLPYPVPDRPWQVFAADLFVLPHRKFVVLVDYYSKYECHTHKLSTTAQVKAWNARHSVLSPIKSRLLTPKTYNTKEVQCALEARQQIHPGDTLRMRQGNTWEPVVVVGESKAGEPRSYIVRANNHTYFETGKIFSRHKKPRPKG